MKKILMLLVTLTALCAVGCVKEPSAPVEKAKATVTSNLGTQILGETNVNPKEIEYIDITFDKPMSYAGGYVYKNHTNNTIVGYGWVNNYTYRYYLNLIYDTTFHLVINVSKYTSPDWDPTKTFWRDADDNYVEELIIEFSTIPYPEREATTFEIDLTNPQNNVLKSIKLEPNYYDPEGNPTENAPSQQLLLDITSFLNRELLIPGDTLKIKYKISSMYDISKVKSNLVDNSPEANYWKILSNSNDLSIAPDYVISEDPENPKIHEGTLEFNITEAMIRVAAIQLFCSYDEVAEDISIDFHTN